jgi:hypothetical protein
MYLEIFSIFPFIFLYMMNALTTTSHGLHMNKRKKKKVNEHITKAPKFLMKKREKGE